jgi:N-methylhydantoinase A/oxoprolinase/acetone carboxylase beta subunit
MATRIGVDIGGTFTDLVESIAVVLINSYRDPAHELRIEILLREAGFDGGLSLSYRLGRAHARHYPHATGAPSDEC